MAESVVQGVIETMDVAHHYRMQLAELLSVIEDAKAQVTKSSNDSRKHLVDHFTQLKTSVCDALDTQMERLTDQVSEIEGKALRPLEQSEQVIQTCVTSAANVLSEGKELLSGDHEAAADAMEKFKKKADVLNSLPEVPPLSEVACVSVDLPEGLGDKFSQLIKDYGKVIPRAPVQITEISDRPGGMHVKWIELEEASGELGHFQLQYCLGTVKDTQESKTLFHHAYEGPATSFTVRHLRAMTQYSFRVRGRAEDAKNWSPWSIPVTSMTSLHHHEWQETQGYELSNQNKIASRMPVYVESPLIFSRTNSYTCGQQVVFKVLECGECCRDDGISVLIDNTSEDIVLQKGCLFMQVDGKVFLDGQEKLTVLPKLKRGSVLTFDTDVLEDNKVRVTVGVEDKILTFDWTLENIKSPAAVGGMTFGMGVFQPQLGNKKNVNLYFAMKFTHEKWKVAVE